MINTVNLVTSDHNLWLDVFEIVSWGAIPPNEGSGNNFWGYDLKHLKKGH